MSVGFRDDVEMVYNTRIGMRCKMQTYQGETTISQDGKLSIKGLPFRSGEKVVVIVRGKKQARKSGARYPLRGKPIQYASPFESVAENDWDSLK